MKNELDALDSLTGPLDAWRAETGHPHVAGLAITMEENYGRPRSAGAHINRGAVGRYMHCAEFRRKVEGIHDDLQRYRLFGTAIGRIARSGSPIKKTAK
jgi:hypothetical protein